MEPGIAGLNQAENQVTGAKKAIGRAEGNHGKSSPDPHLAAPEVFIPADEISLMHQELNSTVLDLGDSLQLVEGKSKKIPADMQQEIAAKCEQIKSLVSQLSTRNTIKVKRAIRKEWWGLKEVIEQMPVAEPFKGLLAHVYSRLGEMDNLTLDLTVEKRQRFSMADNSSSTCRQDNLNRPARKHIANFEVLAPELSRGGQPDEAGYRWLASNDFAIEIALVEKGTVIPPLPASSRIKRHIIEAPDWGSPSIKNVLQFFSILDEADGSKSFLHCKAGIGRTGTFIACQRIREGWTAEKALAEANAFTYSGELIDEQQTFVREFEDYWRGLQH